MISVISVIGITDYVYMFEDVARNDVVGIKEVKVLRFSADADGIICGYYKPCQRMEGWFPKPLEDNMGFRYYQKLFRPQDDPSEGIALQIDTKWRPGMERGQRQQWIYKVKYASGVERDIPVKCVSLPFGYTKGNQLDLLVNPKSARHQEFNGTFNDGCYRQKIDNNILTLLRCRHDTHPCQCIMGIIF